MASMHRQRRLAKGSKTEFYCKDGPLKGHKLFLHTAPTLTFTLNGETGRYESVDSGQSWQQLSWVPKDEQTQLTA